MSAPAFPQPFGRYLLDAKLAAGGMGEVFLARMAGPAGFEKRVVIKRVLPHLAESAEFVERFLDEGRLVVRLSHGNIAQVLDMGEVAGQYFMAIEHVDGLDLRELLRRLGKQRLPVPIVLAVIAEVAKGLDYAHGRVDENGRNLGIIHRDVSPSNVVISKSGDVKLLDFGIAVANDRKVQSISGTLHGKFLYMSPEQAAGRTLDRRSDVFSLGTVAYELLTGVRGFEGGSDLATLERIRAANHTPVREERPDLDAAVAGIVERCLELDPARRFQTAQEVVRAIMEHFLEARIVVSHGDIAAALAPHLSVRAPTAPVTVDDAFNRELEALLGEGSPRKNVTQAAPRPHVAGTISESRPITATGQAPVVDSAVPRSSRNRILIAAITLLVGVLVTLNLTMLSELRDRGTERVAVAPEPEVSEVSKDLPPRRPIDEMAETERRTLAPERVEPLEVAPRVVAAPLPPSRLLAEEGAPRLPRREPDNPPQHKKRPVTPLPVPEPAPMMVGEVKFRVSPAAASIRIDGNPIANTGKTIVRELKVGQHSIVATWNGKEVSRSFEIRPGPPATNLGNIDVSR